MLLMRLSRSGRRSTPLERKKSLLDISDLKRPVSSSVHCLRFTLMRPLVRSECSTEGIPCTTSMLSTSSVEMERISTPALIGT